MSGRLDRVVWNAHRFGLTPSKLRARLFDGSGPAVVSNSLPKAGTHLLERALCLHPRIYRSLRRTVHDRRVPSMGDLADLVPRMRPGELLVTHLSYNTERESILSRGKAAGLFLIRDPRDIVISQAHYVVKNDRHPHHETLSRVDDFQQRLRTVIVGDEDRGMPSLHSRLSAYAGWLTSSALVVRYEDLIGASGGGSKRAQLESLKDVFQHVGLEVSPAELESLAGEIFSDASPTFRRGRIYQWREQFDEETVAVFDETVGEFAEIYGYGSHVHPTDS